MPRCHKFAPIALNEHLVRPAGSALHMKHFNAPSSVVFGKMKTT
jgi:hypothetical protein